MAALGTLVTVITADTSGFTTGMNKAAEETKAFSGKMTIAARENTESMSRWGEEVEHLGHKFTSLHGLLAIGLGVHLGRALFSELHKGLMELASGFGEGMAAGEGFFASIGEGIRKVTGLETHIEQLTKRQKENTEFAKKVGASSASLEEANAPKEIGKLVKQLEEKQKGFEEAASPGLQKISDLQATLKIAQDTARRQGGTEFMAPRDTPFEIQHRLDEATKEYAGVIQASVDHEKILNEAREKLSTIMDQSAAPIRAKQLLFGGYGNMGSGLQQMAEGMLHQIADPIKSVSDKLGGTLGGAFSGAFHGFMGGMMAKSVNEAIRQTDNVTALQEKMQDQQEIQNERLKAKRKAENAPLVGSFGGLKDLHDALQKAALGGKKDEELAELKKHTQNLQDANAHLKALDDRAQPLVWAGNRANA